MAFLRMDRQRVRAKQSERVKRDRKATLAEQRDAWLAQRQAERRNPQAVMLGKTFATKRKAAEYGKRLVTGETGWKSGGYMPGEGQLLSPKTAGDFRGDDKPREMRSMKAHGKASMTVKKDTVGPASGAVRVRPVNGVWRRYVEADDGWRWVSDHASMEAALEAREPLNAPE